MLPIRRRPAIAALRPVLALALALLAGAAAAQRPEIAIPADPWTTAGRVYVLPVFYVPSDSAHSAADAADPTLDLDGEPMAPAAARELHRAKRSLAAHLQVAQEKYRRMLVRPGNPPADRGTFTLATWVDGAARVFDPAHGELEPYVHRSPNGSLEIIADHFFDADRWVYSELLDALGCEQQSCPFVFVIVYWGPQPTLALPTFRFSPMAGVSVNVGANGGAGYLYTDGATLLQAHLPTGPPFQSTLLHELGHAFGLPHVWEVYGGDTGGPAFSAPAADHVAYCARTRFEPGTEKYALACSRSVMSYNVLNRFFGCVELGGSPVPGFPGEPPVEHCVVPADPAAIDAVPGLLIAEDRYQLGLNTRVFPDHSFEEGVDLAEGESIRAYAGPGGWEVPGQATFQIVSSQGTPWPNRIAGMRSKPIPPRHEPFDAVAMWRAEPGPEGWVTLDLELPRAARISRLRLHSGTDSPLERPRWYELLHLARRDEWVSCGTDKVLEASNVLAPGGCGPSAHYRLRLGASAGGVIVVRGLRIFLEDGSGEMEVFPHRRPQAATTAGATFGSSIGNLVATDRVIDPPDDPFDAARGWHSGPVGRGQWPPVEITFPDDVTLGSVRAATGHTGGVHAPNRLRIERRLPGGTFQPVTEKPIQGTQSIAFQPARAKVWRLSFRAGATGLVVVRGLRFFDAEGEELFPALGSFD